MAEQHLTALQVLLENGMSGVTLGPPARSVAEASGRMMWLLDNRLALRGVDARRRVARLMLDSEENAKVFKRLSYDFDHPDRAKAGDAARRAADSIRLPGLFYDSEIDVNEKTGRVILCGQILPGPSGFVCLAGELFGVSPRETSGYCGYMSAMTHPTVFAFIETLADVKKLPADVIEIPFKRDESFAAKLGSNAVRDFYNAWKVWISWTETGTAELDRVHAAHTASVRDRG